jgi:hypothetical protein
MMRNNFVIKIKLFYHGIKLFKRVKITKIIMKNNNKKIIKQKNQLFNMVFITISPCNFLHNHLNPNEINTLIILNNSFNN